MSVNGTELFFKEQGEGPPVLLIHGAATDADTWGESFDDLARDHRTIAYDRRGYSRSIHPPIKDYHGHAEDAAGLLHQLEAAPATVAGWSSGGLVALDLAVGHPDLLTSLVLIEPPLYGRKQIDLSLARAFVKTQFLRRRRGDLPAAENWYRWVTGYSSGGNLWDRDDYPEERRQTGRRNATVTLVEMGARDPDNLSRDRLATIRCPVTCVVGELSQPWFHKTSGAVRKVIPQTTMRTIRGSNHAFGWEKPVELAQAIREAVAERSRAVGAG